MSMNFRRTSSALAILLAGAFATGSLPAAAYTGTRAPGSYDLQIGGEVIDPNVTIDHGDLGGVDEEEQAVTDCTGLWNGLADDVETNYSNCVAAANGSATPVAQQAALDACWTTKENQVDAIWLIWLANCT
jgi:hypothetical protein